MWRNGFGLVGCVEIIPRIYVVCMKAVSRRQWSKVTVIIVNFLHEVMYET